MAIASAHFGGQVVICPEAIIGGHCLIPLVGMLTPALVEILSEALSDRYLSLFSMDNFNKGFTVAKSSSLLIGYSVHSSSALKVLMR